MFSDDRSHNRLDLSGNAKHLDLDYYKLRHSNESAI